MLIEEVPLPKKFITLYKSVGVRELYPPQEQLVESGILEEKKNMVLCTPTASGKTFAAEILMAKALDEGKKAVYVVPLRALAYEKFREFHKYEDIGLKVRLEMGDMDSSRYKNRLDFDLLVTTAEKCDSILRSRPEWFQNTGVLVMDEVHLIASDRGPVYEILVSKFQMLFGDLQVLALSATIGNAGELAHWLNAGLLLSDWRPVELIEEVEVGRDKYGKLKKLVQDSVSEGGQVLVFVNSRKSSESVAEKLGEELKLVEEGQREDLELVGEDILSALSTPTTQCRKLRDCIISGTAFHHAGVTNKQRILVEDAFKEGLVKVIVATPTLAAGVNLPSRTVIVRDVQRYGEGELDYIPVLEYKQQVGRAGRPKYDTYGKAILLARTDSEREFFIEKYVNGEVEAIYSRLGVEPVLRFHMLASIASGFTRTENALMEFFRSTFFGHQYGLEGFEAQLKKILNRLEGSGFIKQESRFLIPTALGRRVSELYIDPRTAENYITILGKAEEENRFPVLGLLEMLCDSSELSLLHVKRQDEQMLWEEAYHSSEKLFRDLDGFDLDPRFLERFKTARLLEFWINEVSEDTIMESYNVAPGILYQKLQIAEWLVYSSAELSKLLGFKNSLKEMKRLETRIKYGVKDELLPLVSIKGIGRVRARKLWNEGFKSISDLKKADIRKLKSLVGEKTAEGIKEEINKK
ncbi:MAG: DEAD/DEAH box helicase [Candidatus Altiarchaeota archaeon]|nr:DEAD/DEAH box helicase [Candidatus Altiarchaeota archaeon]